MPLSAPENLRITPPQANKPFPWAWVIAGGGSIMIILICVVVAVFIFYKTRSDRHGPGIISSVQETIIHELEEPASTSTPQREPEEVVIEEVPDEELIARGTDQNDGSPHPYAHLDCYTHLHTHCYPGSQPHLHTRGDQRAGKPGLCARRS